MDDKLEEEIRDIEEELQLLADSDLAVSKWASKILESVEGDTHE